MAKSKHRQRALPTFPSEADERRFWETHDTTLYVDWSTARQVRFPNLKPSTETISLRLPAGLLADLKALANKQDIPYQSLLKVFLAERVAREWRSSRVTSVRPTHSSQPTNRVRKPAKSNVRPRRTSDT
jgi:predicted DNA binding CopG/RHH family protein